MKTALKISVLGRFELEHQEEVLAGLSTKRAEALLIYLACHKQPQPREILIDLFWPDYDQVSARRNFNNTLYRLRQPLGDYVESTRQAVGLIDSQTVWCDVAVFEKQLADIDLSQPLNESKAQDLATALDLYQGDFLAGFHVSDAPGFADWVAVERERLHQRDIEGLHLLVQHYATMQVYNQGIDWAQRLVTIDPFDEIGHQQLLQLYTLNGQRNLALAHFKRFRHMLAEEMGVEPTAETIALYEAIRDETWSGLTQMKAASVIRPAEIEPSEPPPEVPTVDPYLLLSRLDPLPDQHLYGVETAQVTLETVIQKQVRPWLIAIDGIGGIGKTTLAHRLAQSVIQAQVFADLGWISAKQETLSVESGLQASAKPVLTVETLTDLLLEQLAIEVAPTASAQEKRLILFRRLKQTPTFIIIDNLETVSDYQALLPYLRHLANPSKFLLTTRHSLKAQADVYSFSLNELSQDDALALIRDEADLRGNTTLATAEPAQLNRIYQVVGGNPLALKMVIGQVAFMPLDTILTQLQHAQGQDVDDLYTYIYWQAWQLMNEETRNLFVSLPVYPNGTFADLADSTQLAQRQLQQSLQHLITLSLVIVGGDVDQPRYRLHRLTETFLLNEVLKWQQPTTESAEPTKPVEQPHQRYQALFQNKVAYALNVWHQHEAIRKVDVPILTKAQESILRIISFGLGVADFWPQVRELVQGFTPYMERRGHWDEWNRILLRAIAAADQVADHNAEITLTSLLARLYQRQSKPEKTIYHYRRSIRLAREADNQFELARACSNLGYLFIDEEHWWRSEMLSCWALGIFEGLDSDHGKAHTHNHLGLLYTRQEDWHKAESHLKQACTIWEQKEDQFALIEGCANLGVLYIEKKNYQLALDFLERANLFAEQVGEEAMRGTIYMNLGVVFRMRQNYNKAKWHYDQAEEIFNRFSNRLGLAQLWANIGNIFADQQVWHSAQSYFEASLNLYRDLNNQIGITRNLDDLASIKTMAGDCSE